jgi:hypothetical protein
MFRRQLVRFSRSRRPRSSSAKSRELASVSVLSPGFRLEPVLRTEARQNGASARPFQAGGGERTSSHGRMASMQSTSKHELAERQPCRGANSLRCPTCLKCAKSEVAHQNVQPMEVQVSARSRMTQPYPNTRPASEKRLCNNIWKSGVWRPACSSAGGIGSPSECPQRSLTRRGCGTNHSAGLLFRSISCRR